MLLQQEQVLGELQWYIHQHPKPDDADTTLEVLKYLEACNLLFEQGFLSHSRIRSLDSEVLKNIDQGFSYFAEWLNSILAKGMYTHTHITLRSFILNVSCFSRSHISSYFKHAEILPVMAK